MRGLSEAAVLEHHLHLPPERSDLRLRRLRDVLAGENNFARGRLVDGALPRAPVSTCRTRLVDESDGLALRYIEIDAADRVHDLRPEELCAAAGNA